MGIWKRLIAICTLGAIAALFVIGSNPINSKILKFGSIICFGAAWTGLVILLWKRPVFKVALFIIPLAVTLLCLLPSPPIDTKELREDYVRRLRQFEGTRYVWGGESARGIDCSGLPRRAYRDALLSYGIGHLNGNALRDYFEQWWFDASALALGSGYRNYTTKLLPSGTIHDMDYTGLAPGDLAVVRGGNHTLVFAGEDLWIQACPMIGAVKTLDGRKVKNGWFGIEVTTHRWSALASTDSSR